VSIAAIIFGLASTSFAWLSHSPITQ